MLVYQRVRFSHPNEEHPGHVGIGSGWSSCCCFFGAAKRDQTRPIKFTYVVDCSSIFYIVPFKYNLVVLNGIEAALSSY